MRWHEVEGVMTARRLAALEKQTNGTVASTEEPMGSDSNSTPALNAEEETLEEEEDKEEDKPSSPQKIKSSQKLLAANRLAVSTNKTLNVFDLVNQCGGFALDKIFNPAIYDTNLPDKTNIKSNVFRYISELPPEIILKRLSDIITGIGFEMSSDNDSSSSKELSSNSLDPTRSSVCILNLTKIKAIKITSKGKIGLNAYAFVLSSSLSLLEIKRGKGDILEFMSIYTSVIEPELIKNNIVRSSNNS